MNHFLAVLLIWIFLAGPRLDARIISLAPNLTESSMTWDSASASSP